MQFAVEKGIRKAVVAVVYSVESIINIITNETERYLKVSSVANNCINTSGPVRSLHIYVYTYTYGRMQCVLADQSDPVSARLSCNYCNRGSWFVVLDSLFSVLFSWFRITSSKPKLHIHT